ncbi:hypothetical protein BLOT_007771 [Blomia tropicalis]|nr:hypothetical protein BLOT_007771 [Blomia tropicalis]
MIINQLIRGQSGADRDCRSDKCALTITYKPKGSRCNGGQKRSSAFGGKKTFGQMWRQTNWQVRSMTI